MKTHLYRNRLCRRQAFTLVELLVVLAIIAMLAGIAFPSFGAIMRKMKREQARQTGQQIVNSIKSYYTEYSKYPVPPGTEGGEMEALRTDEILTGALLGTDTTLNPKKIPYLPDLKPVEAGRGPGLFMNGEQATLVDPWGEEYYVHMDLDYDNKIENPNAESSATTVYQGVLVYSAGEDKDPATWEDNVTTWADDKKVSNQTGAGSNP